MNLFINSMKNKTYTQNNALTHKSTESSVLDFFSRAGGLRGDSQTAYELFLNAYNEDAELAMKALFWLRDVRGGAGERDLFRNILSNFYDSEGGVPEHLISLIPEYGRWDDVVSLVNGNDTWTGYIATILMNQFKEDISNLSAGENVSLLAKWLPSVNTSSKDSRAKAKYLAKHFGLTEKGYRKLVSALRKHIKIVEQKMSAGEWDEIDYESVPSRASMIYRNAFQKHDPDGYAQYLSDVESGKKEIKAGTLYPYDIVRKVLHGSTDKTLKLQWISLPDYLAENPHNGLVVCDTSGSMFGGINPNLRPIDVSISLALYIAERNKGAFHNYFLTFSSRPQLQPVVGKNLFEKIRNLENADWAMNTDLEAVFKLILGRAEVDNVPELDMPKVLYIISDMEFDQCVDNPYATNFESIKQMYQEYGYDLPQVVFWNVNSKSNQSPVKMHESGTALVSGASPAIFTSLLKGMDELEQMTPYNMMLKTLLSERYEKVTLQNQ